MTVATTTIRNGVDTEKMFATLDLIKAQPELARFQFRATNRWIEGAHNRSTIKGFLRRRRRGHQPRRGVRAGCGRAGDPARHGHGPEPG